MPAGIFGPLVAAAGNISGGLAAQALIGDTSAPPGGGIPGLTTSQGYGKNHDQGTAIQVDPSTALNYFKQAAGEQEASYRKGLQYYATSLAVAARQMQSAYLDANSTLKPLSQASNDALNEQLKMMGMNPISATVSFADRFAFSNNDPAYQDIANKLRYAETLTDTAERAKIKSEILTQAQQLKTAKSANYSSLGERPKIMSYADFAKYGVNGAIKTLPGMSETTMTGAVGGATYDQYTQMAAQKAKEWDDKKASIDSQLSSRTSMDKTAGNQLEQWGTLYKDNMEKGYTGEEATDRLEQTPGYQFQMTQGTKAIARSQAARGMLRSGNTQLGIQAYGQGLAEQTFNTYMNRLSGIVAQGSGATGQISANQIGEGDYLAGLTQQGGLAAMETERAIGDYRANSLVHAGDTFVDVSKFNANAQNQAISQMRATKSDQIVAGQNAGVGAMNAATNRGALGLAQQQFNYGIRQNNQVGRGYYGGSSAPVYGRDFVSQGGSYITG